MSAERRLGARLLELSAPLATPTMVRVGSGWDACLCIALAGVQLPDLPHMARLVLQPKIVIFGVRSER
jgi:hypothetical protein